MLRGGVAKCGSDTIDGTHKTVGGGKASGWVILNLDGTNSSDWGC